MKPRDLYLRGHTTTDRDAPAPLPVDRLLVGIMRRISGSGMAKGHGGAAGDPSVPVNERGEYIP